MIIPEMLLEHCRRWADQHESADPGYFERLAEEQHPSMLWIGCSDSRVSPNEIAGLGPGELFVHRNIGNICVQNDLNSMAVVQFAIEVLRVPHIIICGHTCCGAVNATLHESTHGPVDAWLDPIREVMLLHQHELEQIQEPSERVSRLAELNVLQQVINLCTAPAVTEAWARRQALTVHGWIFELENGFLRPTGLRLSSPDDPIPDGLL